MPIFERPPLDTVAPAKDRWTAIYLKYGRMEVDDASIKWIGSDGLITRLPVASVSALILGPGTAITHAAVKAAAQCNCPLLWLGEDGLRFYAFGITPNHDNSMARIHASAWANKQSQNEIARRMFLHRFPQAAVQGMNIRQLRGMEGKRVKQTYSELGAQYGVTWKGRDYKTENWQLADGINRALSASNASLYALTAAVCCSMGFIPQLGFVHAAGTLPFIYDAADLYKHNVFVGTLNVLTFRKMRDFILRNAPKEFGMLVISSAPNCQGYEMERIGPEGKAGRKPIELSGIPLIAESWVNEDNQPF